MTSDQPRKISKSQGQTPTEGLLSELCDKTFLKLWSYANPFKSDGKELCDLIAVFENHVFLFFDRESRTFDTSSKDISIIWERWKKTAIERQINTADGASRYLQRCRDDIYLDAKCTVRLPIKLADDNLVIHKFIVAHGAKDACHDFSPDNVSGSLAISYSDDDPRAPFPFLVHLRRADPIHILDSHTLSIILAELDTFYDFVTYIDAKEAAIHRYDCLSYCGEEDLLAHYFRNFDRRTKSHFIGTTKKRITGIFIEEGTWLSFVNSEPYRRKKEADVHSYLWDDLLQRTTQNALDGTLLGNSDIYNSRSAIFEMAKEPRFARRSIADRIINSIRIFPYDQEGVVRSVAFIPSFYPDKAYVFLQLRWPKSTAGDYDTVYRPRRQAALEIACGVARNKFPHLKKVIGIAIDAPKDDPINSEDFLLMDDEEWPDEQRKKYEEANKELKIFETDTLQKGIIHVKNFPDANNSATSVKIGRNARCPCGSGKKFKKCHGSIFAGTGR
ncbi:MAG: SEC-C domain-containing protein [Xanthobacteraceae bacterium]